MLQNTQRTLKRNLNTQRIFQGHLGTLALEGHLGAWALKTLGYSGTQLALGHSGTLALEVLY